MSKYKCSFVIRLHLFLKYYHRTLILTKTISLEKLIFSRSTKNDFFAHPSKLILTKVIFYCNPPKLIPPNYVKLGGFFDPPKFLLTKICSLKVYFGSTMFVYCGILCVYCYIRVHVYKILVNRFIVVVKTYFRQIHR